MIKEKFKFSLALKDGIRFVAHNFSYLAKISTLPLIVHIVCNLFVQLQRPNASIIEAYLWQLPSVAMFGWLMFAQIRLLFFLEKVETIITHSVFVAERHQAKQASIIIFILFNMFYKFCSIGLFMLSSSKYIETHAILSLLPIIIIIFMFLSVRFAVLHIVAAISFPIKLFLKRTNTPIFSVQLIALAVVSMFPIMILLQIIVPLISPSLLEVTDIADITDIERIKLVLVSAPVTLLASLLLNSCAGCAIKQMLSFTINKKI